MARLESVSIGGYYATPPHLVSRIASLVAPVEFPVPEVYESGTYRSVNESSQGLVYFMDPCAGDGAAILGVVSHLVGVKGDPTVTDPALRKLDSQITIYASEMEGTRAEALKKNMGVSLWSSDKHCLTGDAFRVAFKRDKNHNGVGLLYLNPPYDTDHVHGRLEQRFLDRFTSALCIDGILIFVVPFYALKASAECIAREYRDVRCFRFPAADFEGYRQVVLVARKRESLLTPDVRLMEQVQAWAADASMLPELPAEGSATPYRMPVVKRYGGGGIDDWKTRPVDLTNIVAKLRPWETTVRAGVTAPIPGVLPDMPVQDLMLRTYPVAVPVRPAHIAAGIASGLFNGARIDPDKGKFPSMLVKGVFDREYRTVEEKKNKDGEVTTVIQVQQPKLVVTVLNLETHKYHVLSSGTEATGTKDVATMNVADLLEHYGNSLMKVMEHQCPVLYDPRRDADSIPLAPSPRKLFTAQGHATKAIIKLLGGPKATKRARRGRAAILLGEIGSGKSTVSLMAARTIGSRRVLIMCPPHLLDGWKDQIAAVVPDADVQVLASVEDIQRVAEIKDDRMVVCIMSREAAKLSHSWEGVSGMCPKCGAAVPPKREELAKQRATCASKPPFAVDDIARESVDLAVKLLPYAPSSSASSLLRFGRFNAQRAEHYWKNESKRPKFHGLKAGTLDRAIDYLLKDMVSHGSSLGHEARRALMFALLAAGSDEKILEVAATCMAASQDSVAYEVLHLLGPDHHSFEAFHASHPDKYSSPYSGWSKFAQEMKTLGEHKDVRTYGPEVSYTWSPEGVLSVDGHGRGSLTAAIRALETLGHAGQFGWAQKECGEELYGAVPEPRRVALAKHIVSYYRDTFDFLILDEGHEYATDGSAQERSAHRLTTLGLPTILMTGTIMNGYAESLFMNMWAVSQEFRAEFRRDERARYVDRYGYRKRALQDKDVEGNVIEFGSQSDRVALRSERIVGSAPGILPLFLLRHLLPIAVTLHKSDLAIDLPACHLVKHEIEPSREQLSRFDSLKRQLIEQIRKDQFVPDYAGKLFGQLAELPSYLDRATVDVGNVESGDYEIRYPETLDNKLVAAQPGFDSTTLLPKEEWMLDLIETKLAQGRNVMVFSWHVALLPRLARLIEERTGEKAVILYADKVATGKRQGWIDREILKKGRRILVTNPVAIQTGLNNLVHFSQEIWMENPACNPITFRQAVGRIDRIGQTQETEVHFPIYKGTLQVALYDLLMKKNAVSVSTDGLDPESALQAAGLGEDEYLAGLSIGKQLWSMIGGMGEVVPLNARRHKAPTSKVG